MFLCLPFPHSILHAATVNPVPKQSFVLYRILGNSLNFRHRSNEVLENLRFILEHEGDLEGCEKRWVLNRIADQDMEADCIALIDDAGHQYLRIPFDLGAYAGCFLDGSDLPMHLLPFGPRNEPRDVKMEALALEWQYRHKSLYAISLNLARNRAVEEGQRLARWTLPFDGSCFFTEQGWKTLSCLAAADLSALHLIVPITRVSNNTELLQDNFAPAEFTEPQIGFRNDSTARFDERLRYGHMNKTELLRTLGVPGPWQDWQLSSPWEVRENRVSPERGRFVEGSWVARLQATHDQVVESGDFTRWQARFLGTKTLCDQLDQRIAEKALRRNFLSCYAREPLVPANAEASKELLAAVTDRAQEAIRSRIPTILDKATLPPSGDKRDYISVFPYFHAAPDGSITVRDGIRNAESMLSGEASRGFDRAALESFMQRACATALAGAMTGERNYFRYAGDLLRAWFITEGTRMNPNMKYAHVIPREPIRGHISGIVDFRNVWALIDAIKLTWQSGELSDDELNSIKAWFKAFLVDITGRELFRQLTNVGSWSDLIVASISAFIGRPDIAAKTVSAAPLRTATQLSAFSVPYRELKRAKPLRYCLVHLEACVCLAWFGRSIGIDLWRHTASLHRNIAFEARFIALNRSYFDDYSAESELFDQTIAAVIGCIPNDAVGYDGLTSLELPRAFFISHDPDLGLPPFWPAMRVPG